MSRSGVTGSSRPFLQYCGCFDSIEFFEDVLTLTYTERYFLSVALDLSVGSVDVNTVMESNGKTVGRR
jgi:hypothetical protein